MITRNRMFSTAVALAATVALAGTAAAQTALDLPRPSPKATVTQTVGLTEVAIAYCRPGVKARTIWGGLVPYDQVWRTGANEATTITFADEATIAGTKVAPGTYGLFTIPGKDEWTVILNKGAKLWGAYEYTQADDVLRFKVAPQKAEFSELLTFAFTAVTPDQAEIALTWEKVRVAFKIGFATTNKVLASARKAIAEAKADDWRTPYRAAAFCLDSGINLDEAATWLDASTKASETFYNVFGRARLAALKGDKVNALTLAKKAIEVGNAAQPKADVAPAEAFLKEMTAK